MEHVCLFLMQFNIVNIKVLAQTFIKMLKNLMEKHENFGAACGHGHLVSQKEGLFNNWFMVKVNFMEVILKNINSTEII